MRGRKPRRGAREGRQGVCSGREPQQRGAGGVHKKSRRRGEGQVSREGHHGPGLPSHVVWLVAWRAPLGTGAAQRYCGGTPGCCAGLGGSGGRGRCSAPAAVTGCLPAAASRPGCGCCPMKPSFANAAATADAWYDGMPLPPPPPLQAAAAGSGAAGAAGCASWLARRRTEGHMAQPVQEATSCQRLAPDWPQATRRLRKAATSVGSRSVHSPAVGLALVDTRMPPPSCRSASTAGGAGGGRGRGYAGAPRGAPKGYGGGRPATAPRQRPQAVRRPCRDPAPPPQPPPYAHTPERVLIGAVVANVEAEDAGGVCQPQHLQQVRQRGALVPVHLRPHLEHLAPARHTQLGVRRGHAVHHAHNCGARGRGGQPVRGAGGQAGGRPALLCQALHPPPAAPAPPRSTLAPAG